MKTPKLKNKINEVTGYFCCGGEGDKGCGCEIGLGIVIRGVAYCQKCARRLRKVKNES